MRRAPARRSATRGRRAASTFDRHETAVADGADLLRSAAQARRGRRRRRSNAWSRAIVSSRSGLPRRWFSARAVSVNGNGSRAPPRPRPRFARLRGQGRRGAARRVPVLDRAADRAGLGDALDGRAAASGSVRSRSRGRPRPAGRSRRRAPTRARPLVQRDLPSSRPSVNANPPLVVASASKPIAGEHPRRPRIPRVRDQERLALVQRPERLSLLDLSAHAQDSARHGASSTSGTRIRSGTRSRRCATALATTRATRTCGSACC